MGSLATIVLTSDFLRKHPGRNHTQDEHAGARDDEDIEELKSKKWGTEHLRQGRISSITENPNNGLSVSYFGKTEDGRSVFLKPNGGAVPFQTRFGVLPGRDAEREYAAFAVNKYLGASGVPMPGVALRRREGDTIAVMDRLTGRTLAEESRGIASLTGKEEFLRFTMFDGLIGNSDRYFGNLFMDSTTKRVTAIDHAAAFPGKLQRASQARVLTGGVFTSGTQASYFGVNLSTERLHPGHVVGLTRLVRNAADVRRVLKGKLTDEELDGLFNRARFMLRTRNYIHVGNAAEAHGNLPEAE